MLKKLYVGIDVHASKHKVAIIPVHMFERSIEIWEKVSPITIINEYDSFEYLNQSIRTQINDTSDVIIAIDHTGGHYSEPIVFYLLNKGYDVYFIESKGMKVARERLLDKEIKNDAIDSISAAYMLYLRDIHGLSFRISYKKYELGSEAAVLNSLILQRLQFVKLITQITNRLHQYLIATFPEGEAKYFNKLLKIIPHYPTPQDICNSDGLKGTRGITKKDNEDLLKLGSYSVGVFNNS